MSRPKSISTTVEIFGVRVAAIQHYTSEGYAPSRWVLSPQVTIRVPSLIKLLRTVGERASIEAISAFSGMTDGSEPVPAAERATPIAWFIDYLGGKKDGVPSGDASWVPAFSSRTGGIYFDPSTRAIHVFDACRSFDIHDRTENTRRAEALGSRPLPSLMGVYEVEASMVEGSRARYLDHLDPMAFDEAHAVLTGPGMDDPLCVLAIVDPAWLARLQKASDGPARNCSLADQIVAASEVGAA